MYRFKRLINCLLLCAFVIILPSISVLAESDSYDSTYYMTKGVYSSRTWDTTNTPTFTVDLYNCYSVVPDNIYVMLQRRVIIGWDTKDSDTIDSALGGSCSLTGDTSGEYRLYLRQTTGYLMSGDITISWTW